MNYKRTFLIIITAAALLFLINYSGKAEFSLKNILDTAISKNNLSKTAVVSVSIRETESGELIYEEKGNLLLHPASTLKAFTTPVMLEHLGIDSKIRTGLYRYKNNFYLKLSGDPLLTKEDLVNLFKQVKNKGINSIENPLIIDDSVIDDIPWGIGWMWDDENNPHMPKYNAYNLDNNLIKIKVAPGEKNIRPVVAVNPDFPVKIFNQATLSEKNDLTIERRPWQDPDIIYITGEIASSVQKTIPVGNPEKHFIHRLRQAIKENGIDFSGRVQKGEVPTEAVLLEEITHTVLEEVTNINQKSNNLAAETLFKHAGGEFSGSVGTTKDGVKAFKEFYTQLDADPEKLFIVDGSGVSHNDLMYTNWMTLALSKLYNWKDFGSYLKTLAVPDAENSLNGRFDDLSGKIWAKTGTLAGVSGLTGYLKTDSGKIYSFAILIQNYKGSSEKAKKLENKIIKILANF